MEAYKELHRHKRNEEKRQEQITCFQKIWTGANIFGRLSGTDIKWHLPPPPDFLPQELGAWMIPPIRIHSQSPSPDIEAEFAAQLDFSKRVQDFLTEIGNNFPIPSQSEHELIPESPETGTRTRETGEHPICERERDDNDSTQSNQEAARGNHSSGEESESINADEFHGVGLPPNAQQASARMPELRKEGEIRPLSSLKPNSQQYHHSDIQQAKQPPQSHPLVASVVYNEARESTCGRIPTSRTKIKCKFGPKLKRFQDKAPNFDQSEIRRVHNEPD